MEFIATPYKWLVLLLLLLNWRTKNKCKFILINTIATANTLLLLNSVFLVRQYIGLYYLAKQLNLNTQSSYFSYTDFFSSWQNWLQILILFIPFLFLFKKLMGNQWLTAIVLILFWWNDVANMFSGYLPTAWNINDVDFYLLLKILNYGCLLIAAYALLWLFKKLPSQYNQHV